MRGSPGMFIGQLSVCRPDMRIDYFAGSSRDRECVAQIRAGLPNLASLIGGLGAGLDTWGVSSARNLSSEIE